jgi:hypothetical protein
MSHMQTTLGGTVVAFRSSETRSKRAAPSAGEQRGAILLFTGVRYEREIGDGPLMAFPRPQSDPAKPQQS